MKGGGEEHGAVARHPPSIGVLGSGRLANTTSTYSSCSRSSDAFRPAAPTHRQVRRALCRPPVRQPAPAQPGAAAGSATGASLPSMMCFRDSPLSVSALEKERWVRARRAPAALPRGWRATYFPPQKILVVITRLDRLQGERESQRQHPQSPVLPARSLPTHIHAWGCSDSFPQPVGTAVTRFAAQE